MRFELLLVIAVLGFAIVAATSPQAFAASDYFLKIDGVDGESSDSKHKGEIHIESWSWGASQSGSMAGSGGGGAGKVIMNDFTFEKSVDKATPKLFEALATGKHMKEAKLTMRKAGGDQHEYLVITLTDVMVTSYSTGGASSSDRPMESFSLNFAQIKMSYVEQDASGKAGAATEFGWDLKKNTRY